MMAGAGRQPESASGRIGGLDGVRAIAAFAVIATHVGFESGLSLRSGFVAGVLARLDFGVTLFFLLSGFVIYRPFAAALVGGRPLPAAREFYRRRALRILPAYWLAIIVTLGALSLRPASRADWLSYLLLVQTIDHHSVDPSLSQMWTLSTELSFYLVLPLFVWAEARLISRVRVELRAPLMLAFPFILIASAVAWRQLTAPNPSLWFRSLLWLPAQLDWFALGMLLATVATLAARPAPPRLVRTLRSWAAQPGACVIIGVSLFLLATLPLAGPRSLFPPSDAQAETKHWLYGISALFLLAPLTLGGTTSLRSVLSWRPVAWLGEISYGIYLWHLPLLIALQLRVLHYPIFSGHFWPLFLATSAAATMAAACSYYALERPLLTRWARKAVHTSANTAAIPARQTS